MSEVDVIVVGCGGSGVAALRRLYDAGLQVLGLEAADRVGGRIHSVEFGECNVDLGATWCLGEHTEVFKLASPLGLLAYPEPYNKWFVLSNGELVPDEDGKDIVKALNDEIAYADKSAKISVSECIKTAAKSNATLIKDPKLTNSFIEWFERNNHVGGLGDPRKSKSLKGLVEYSISSVTNDGELMLNWKGRGYKTILDVFLNKYPDASKELPIQIQLNKEVEEIHWRTDQANSTVQVTCKDGSVYKAKSVIITVSVGFLKERHQQLFNPPLPAEKVDTINNLQLCVLGKIYIEFERPWWPKTPAYFTVLWREEDKLNFSEDERWVTEVYGLQTVDYQPNVLLAWTQDKGAIAMEKVSLEGVRAGIEKVLDVMRKQFDVTPIKNLIRTQWASNPLYRCAYAYRSVITEEEGGSAMILSEPLCDDSGFPVLCFGGEATSHHRHTSADGAVEAGLREADRLIESFKKSG